MLMQANDDIPTVLSPVGVDVEGGHGKKLLQGGGSGGGTSGGGGSGGGSGGAGGGGSSTASISNTATNTLRSQLATADRIQRAVSSGATLPANTAAANTGSQTVFANTQNNPGLFDVVENTLRGKKLLQTGGGGGGSGGGGSTTASLSNSATNTLRSELATADRIQRAVNSGATLGANTAAAATGSQTVFANTQNNPGVFDVVENTLRGKKLLQTGSGGGSTGGSTGAGGSGTDSSSTATGATAAANTLRTELATADTIQKSVNAGAQGDSTADAASDGVTTVFANSQNNPGLFDQVENTVRSGKKLLQDNTASAGSKTLRTEIATADVIKQAANSGAKPKITNRAAAVGGNTVFANAQNQEGIFDVVENSARRGKKLLQTGSGGGSTGAGGSGTDSSSTATGATAAANTLRTELATADTIQKSVNAGAQGDSTADAASDGVTTVFANSQNNPGLFDQVENTVRSGKKLLQDNTASAGSNTLRTEIATADVIKRAANSGAKPKITNRAAAVGGNIVFANAQNQQGLFDQVEVNARRGK
jgi:hypothetical protein